MKDGWERFDNRSEDDQRRSLNTVCGFLFSYYVEGKMNTGKSRDMRGMICVEKTKNRTNIKRWRKQTASWRKWGGATASPPSGCCWGGRNISPSHRGPAAPQLQNWPRLKGVKTCRRHFSCGGCCPWRRPASFMVNIHLPAAQTRVWFSNDGVKSSSPQLCFQPDFVPQTF